MTVVKDFLFSIQPKAGPSQFSFRSTLAPCYFLQIIFYIFLVFYLIFSSRVDFKIQYIHRIRNCFRALHFCIPTVCSRQLLFVKLIFFNFYFPTVQQGDQVILTCIHYNYIFFPHPLFCCNISI